MKKKILFFTVALVALMCAFAVIANAETPEMYIELEARFEGSNDYVLVYTENAGDSTTPKINLNKKFYSDINFTTEVNMANATGIDFSNAYSENTENNVADVVKATSALTKCTEVKWFSDGVTTVGANLFKGWTALSSFDFGCASVIERYAFDSTGFVNLVIPSTVMEMKNYAFSGCVSLKSLSFEDDIMLGTHTFRNCSSLDTIDIDNLTIIGVSMFYNCDAIKSVTVKSSVVSVGDNAFQNCDGLESVAFEDGFQGIIGTGVFSNTTKLKSIYLCEGITSLPKQLFQKAGAISQVTLPNSVKTLGEKVFTGSTLTELVISENSQLELINGDTFSGCKSLKSIYLPSGVKITVTNLFQNCTALERVYNFENVVFATEKGEGVYVGDTFSSCTNLKEIIVPFSSTAITGKCYQISSLERLYVPATIKSISLEFANNIPANCTIFYCGGNAVQLLELTMVANGTPSTAIKSRIDGQKVVNYGGSEVTYEPGYIVANANSCEIFFNGEHIKSSDYIVVFIDEFGKEIDKKYVSDARVSYHCSRGCDADILVEIIPAMFICNGYSVPENGENALTIGYLVNNEAIKSYEKYTNTTLNFGVFAAAKTQLGEGDIFNENGEAADCVVSKDITKSEFFSFDFKIKGFDSEAQRDALLAIGAYVFEDNGTQLGITYIQAADPLAYDKYSYVSYSTIAKN